MGPGLRRGRGPLPVAAFDAVITDHERDITLSGTTQAPLDLGGILVPPGRFIAQLSKKGEARWARHLSDSVFAVIRPALAVDHEDHLLLAGALSGSADFGGGTRTTSSPAAVLVKYTEEGVWLWDRVFESPGFRIFAGAATDEEDHIYVAGTFVESADLGGGPLPPVDPTTETPLIARFTPDGEHVWSRTLDELTAAARLRDIAVHGNRVVVVGDFFGSFRFDGRLFSAPEGDSSGVVLAVTRDGDDRWGRALGHLVSQVRSDLEDDMTIVGTAFPGDDVGTGPLPDNGSVYFHINKFDRVDGSQKWVRVLDGRSVPEVFISVARHGEVAAAGLLGGPVDFGTGTIRPTFPDHFDAFIFLTTP